MNKISVIIPVYNVEQYLRKCVDSVLAQTYTNLEVILVDDGSPDTCGAICDDYAAKDDRVLVIHKENGGVSSARNAGLRVATGEYIALVDSDDYIDPDMYDSLIRIAIKECADVVECNYRRDEAHNYGSGEYCVHSGIEAAKKMFKEHAYPHGFAVSPWNKLMRRAVVEDCSFLEDCSMAEDMLFACELFLRAEKAVKLDRMLYSYRVTEGSATTKDYSVRKADEVAAAEGAMKLFDACGDSELLSIGRTRYAELAMAHWEKCFARRKKAEFANTAKSIRERYIHIHPEIRKSYSRRLRIKASLFYHFPALYFGIARVKEKGTSKNSLSTKCPLF